ncbi:MAG: TonB-dependent siderophore receptor [Cytophagales bacterium]|nr:MAG: TonB-dependent siderophore receptor [Cytophagales bacterium]
MKNSILFIFLFTISLTGRVDAQTQTGTIRGNIRSENEQPLTGINVGLEGTSLGSPTNNDGDFVIANVPVGTYVLRATGVGYSATRQNAVVRVGKTLNLDLQLNESAQTLSDVMVRAERTNYTERMSSVATRTDVPLLETPQSVQSISQRVIKDRQAITLNELSPVMTGVKANNGMGAFSMRGFTGYYPFDASFIVVNGIRGNLYLWSQQPLLYNIERVEVLRGPASVLFSEGIPGGVINMVTKKPQVANRFEFNGSYGTWNFARFSADATGALSGNKKLLYRFIAGYDRTNSFRDYQEKENVFVAPSLTYQFAPKTSLNLEVNYAYARAVHQYDRGTYIKPKADGTFDFNVYPNNLTVQSPTDYGRNHNSSATLTFNHEVNQALSVAVVQRYVRSKFEFADHIFRGAIRNDSVSRGYEQWFYDQFNSQTTAYANYNTSTGIIGHSILAGVDYSRYGWLKNDYRSSPSTRISIFNPDYSNDIPAPNPAVDYYDDNKQIINLIGGYVQDQISFGAGLRALLSLRYDTYRMTQTPLSERDDLQGNASEATAWLPRFGLVYLPRPNLSFYGSYTRSFNPQVSNSGGTGGPFPPRTAEQVEVGYKGDFFQSRLSTMVALYRIDYRNILAPAPTDANPNLQAVVDGTRSEGVELTVQGNIGDASMVVGYAYNNHVLSQNSTLGMKGARFQNAPNHIANAWLKYDLSTTALRGLGIGLGGRYVSDQVGRTSNQRYLIPASTVLDAVVNYERKRVNVQLNINNLTNARYFTGGFANTSSAALGNPFNVRLGVNYLIR